MKKENKPIDIIIRFDNESVAHHFASWLCESGEQDYWNWMEYRETEEEGNITVVDFNYHGEEDKTKKKSDPRRYGEFMCDNIIRTVCGRLDENEE